PAVRVTQPIYSGPAYAAGFRSGDYTWACKIGDGPRIELEGKELEEVIGLLKGEEGTKITLWVKRPGVKDLIELTLTRQTVQTDPALEGMLPGGIGYLKLTQFGDDTTTRAMRESIKALLNQGMKSMILDLRGNPGGQLTTVIDIASMFLPRFTPVTLAKGRTLPYQGEGLILTTGQQTGRGR